MDSLLTLDEASGDPSMISSCGVLCSNLTMPQITRALHEVVVCCILIAGYIHFAFLWEGQGLFYEVLNVMVCFPHSQICFTCGVGLWLVALQQII